MAKLVTITGPIAAGKNTVADLVARACTDSGRTAVIADVDDVAAMVASPGAGAAGLWFGAQQAHGALVAAWLGTAVDVVITVGPVYDRAEQDALEGRLPPQTRPLRVLVEAPVDVTWHRAAADQSRGMSRQYEFHHRAHARYRALRDGIPTDLVFDSADVTAERIAAVIVARLAL